MNFERFSDRLGSVLVKHGKKNCPIISAGFLLILAPTLFIAAFSYFKAYQDLTNSTLSKRQAIAYLGATTLKEKLDRLTEFSISLASRVRSRRSSGEGRYGEAIDIVKNVPGDFDRLAAM